MATALGIPASKTIIRRHLATELEALVAPARSALVPFVRVRARQRAAGGSLGRPFSRSCGGLSAPPPSASRRRDAPVAMADPRRPSIRGSLGRALGLTKAKSDREKQSPTSSSEGSSVVSRVSPPLQNFMPKSSRSGGESPIYAQPFAHQHHAQNLYQRRSEDYDTYACRSIDEYDITKSVQSIKSEVTDGSREGGRLLSHLMGGSLHRNKKQHRRVKSIGDIDVIHQIENLKV